MSTKREAEDGVIFSLKTGCCPALGTACYTGTGTGICLFVGPAALARPRVNRASSHSSSFVFSITLGAGTTAFGPEWRANIGTTCFIFVGTFIFERAGIVRLSMDLCHLLPAPSLELLAVLVQAPPPSVQFSLFSRVSWCRLRLSVPFSLLLFVNFSIFDLALVRAPRNICLYLACASLQSFKLFASQTRWVVA